MDTRSYEEINFASPDNDRGLSFWGIIAKQNPKFNLSVTWTQLFFSVKLLDVNYALEHIVNCHRKKIAS
jgi:hypothetical protein